MAFVTNNNHAARFAQRALNNQQQSLTTTIQRLATGLRINSAKDDAAGLSIANGISSNIVSLSQAARNTQDGISLLQTTEGGLSQMSDNLQAIRRLAVQAFNDTNSDQDIKTLQQEVDQRLAEIDRIAAQTNFNGIKVFARQAKTLLQVGANHGDTIEIGGQVITTKALAIDDLDLTNRSNIATNPINPVNPAQPSKPYADYHIQPASLHEINTQLLALGRIRQPLATANLKIIITLQSGLTPQSIFGVDYQLHQKIDNLTGQIIAGEFVLMTANNGRYDITMHARTMASGSSQARIHLLRNNQGTAGLPGVLLQPTPATNDNILTRIDNALAQINSYRSSLGATENRLAATIDNLANTTNHLQAARSRIQDADFAYEVANLTKTQLLQQMGSSVLKLANQSAQEVLTLLR
ncbi:flagellin [Arsenophonus apicola]|uniref:Flagellin n=1 Tax=Arsenophonus apicola TaxID=2879119 RepID=A0ABY8P1C0_9GAMM|nr:flagellin [Arsenophonus apicola]WGO82640.1 flagellin [Arsenophonus apicola]